MSTRKYPPAAAPAAKPRANTKAKVTKPAPSARKKAPAKTQKAPASSQKVVPAKTQKAPAKTQKASAENQKASAKTQKGPAKTQKAPAKTEKAPAAKSQKAPARTQKTPAKAPKVPAKKSAAATKPAAPAPKSNKRKRDDEIEDASAPKTAPASKRQKAQPKKAAPASKRAAQAPETNKREHSSNDDEAAAATSRAKKAKQAKPLIKGAVINEPPTDRLKVYVFGEGSAGELGLGTAPTAIDVKRPRLNPNLDAEKVGVVQIVAGGMHCIALTADNKILTWGVNDDGALGRETQSGNKYVSMDDAASDDSETNGLNDRESVPMEPDWSTTQIADGTRWVQVAAGDSTCFALTDDGRVYGWGTFRGNKGDFGFTTIVDKAWRPMLLPELKNITNIIAGANHAIALDKSGAAWSWGAGEQSQLGRKTVERTNETQRNTLIPRQFGLPKGPKNGIASISTGGYHSFAISRNGNVYSWGLNNMGQTGHPENAGEDGAAIHNANIVASLKGKNVTSIVGGAKHSVAATANGECFVWGSMKQGESGIPRDDLNDLPEDILMKVYDENKKVTYPAILLQPTKIDDIDGAVTNVAANSDTSIAVTKEGKAYSWGFSGNYQTGTGSDDTEVEATMIDNTAIREQIVTGAGVGGQFGFLTVKA
ncbi:Guanine nucleotide exchange factor SRM1 [Teratosphaeria destructans]|uniref:Guanine nucleotide exchange factor SRM1 n=1 Tax=Teratosphaeria destructans TaxID=418781 RepID=A0A9W7SMV4_9PEZI|nr:Guanine nucleotide exchange factor SRM1 [Teratosphaeria destructans]